MCPPCRRPNSRTVTWDRIFSVGVMTALKSGTDSCPTRGRHGSNCGAMGYVSLAFFWLLAGTLLVTRVLLDHTKPFQGFPYESYVPSQGESQTCSVRLVQGFRGSSIKVRLHKPCTTICMVTSYRVVQSRRTLARDAFLALLQ